MPLDLGELTDEEDERRMRKTYPGYQEYHAFMCACKNEPYLLEEWEAEIASLLEQLSDARNRLTKARNNGGVCLPKRFE